MDTPAEKLAIAAAKLRLALELNEAGFAMKRQQLRRQFPGADEAEISKRFRAWQLDRPMDAPGRPISWEAWTAKRRWQ